MRQPGWIRPHGWKNPLQIRRDFRGTAPILPLTHLMHFHQVTPQPVPQHWEHFHVDIQPLQGRQGAQGYRQTDLGALALPSSRAAPG